MDKIIFELIVSYPHTESLVPDASISDYHLKSYRTIYQTFLDKEKLMQPYSKHLECQSC